MAEELLDRVLREVRERKKRAEAAWEESRRFEAALRALEGERSRTQPQPSTARTRPRSSRGRAPRGQTRDAILQIVAERPGATPAEIAAAANVDRRVAQSTLARLAGQGAIERFSPPGGGTAYRPPSPTATPTRPKLPHRQAAPSGSTRARSPRNRPSTRRTSPPSASGTPP